MRTARAALTALALTATLTLAACGDDEATTAEETTEATPTASPTESPSESPSAPVADAITVTIAGNDISPMAQEVEVEVGEPVVLAITSDRVGELHAHSVPEQTAPIEAGEQTVEMTFDRPGQVDIEEHESGALVVRLLVR